ncbi:MAG TPA: HD domain-containing protein [Spirochaetota bacterium]|nr:HD domain-containing protein [Spirochaetota bacterium]HOM38222.1 HD domain-containing protein [Spirochaetota bacterium]HPQ48560.1 HD domain-containing protein [Spirochaetota bacterium]
MKFLIVDDDPFIQKMLEITLKKNFPQDEIKIANNGIEAVNIVTTGEFIPDIILMDYMMPEMSGLAASKEIRNWAKDKSILIYIIMVTAKSQRETELESLDVVDDFITKPMDMDVFLSRVKVGIRTINMFEEKTKLLKENIKLYDHLVEINLINEKLINKLSEVIEQMAVSLSEAIEYKDLTTGSHVLRVGYISEAIGVELGLNEDKAEMLKYAGFFHDIGKIAIPDNILQKPGRLDENEFSIIKKHSQIGAEIIKPIKYFSEIIDGIRHHHERWDGKGYPDGLSEDKIPLYARIIAVADVFDVIVSKRPYKEPKSIDDAITEIVKNSGTQFDPQVVKIFEDLYKKGIIHKIYERVELIKNTDQRLVEALKSIKSVTSIKEIK